MSLSETRPASSCKLLVQFFGEDPDAGNSHQFFELWTLVQTHLVRLVDHDQSNPVLGCQLFSSSGRNGGGYGIHQQLELGAGDHGLAVGRFGLVRRMVCRIGRES